MEPRLDYRTASPEGYRAFAAVHRHIAASRLDPALVHMVYLRVSQINGCAYCVDLHWRDAVAAGVAARKLNAVACWVEMPFFTARERAALAWAESLTLLPQTGAPDAAYAAARAEFDDRDLADLSYAIALMNAFNRLGVGFRQTPAAD